MTWISACRSTRKILEKLKSYLFFKSSLCGFLGRSRRNSVIDQDQGRALSTENDAGALGIFDNTWQDGSEDAAQSWHDEGG